MNRALWQQSQKAATTLFQSLIPPSCVPPISTFEMLCSKRRPPATLRAVLWHQRYDFAINDTIPDPGPQLSLLLLGCWGVYPIIWIFIDGARAVNTDTAICVYGFLDIVSQCIFGMMLVQNVKGIPTSSRQRRQRTQRRHWQPRRPR